MNLEQIKRTQIVLLTLFVSFITSIATGIVTVTLLDQAPTDVTRTIDRVVEKTVERVVRGETKIVERIREISNPTESDLAINAAAKTGDILLYIEGASGFSSAGFFLSSKGEAVFRAPALVKLDDKFEVIWVGGPGTSTPPTIAMKVSKIDGELMLLSPAAESKTIYPSVDFKQVVIPSLGQRTITVGYDKKLGTKLDFGNVIAISENDDEEGERNFVVSMTSSSVCCGGPVVDVSARVLGISAGTDAELGGQIVVPLPRLALLLGSVEGEATSTPQVQ